ncbi:MAG: ATP-dependent DNA helicase RecG [Eubacterium sp.]|nr:ATP-dependent DNA helicase RecG [Eubacterium sp.]
MISSKNSIDTLKGIGPKKKALYNKIGIQTLENLLHYYPVAYQDRRFPRPISSLVEDESVLVRARISSVASNLPGRGKKQVLRLVVEDDTGKIDVVFFNAFYLKQSLKKGQEYCFYGRTQKNGNKLQMIQPEFESADKHISEIIPVYSTLKGLSQNELRKNIKSLLEEPLQEYMPQNILEERRLCPLGFKVKNLHFPTSRDHLKIAKYRQVYENLFVMQLGMEMMHKDRSEGIVMKESHLPYVQNLPFKLTNAQSKVIDDITCDMESGKAMNRLLQGDVGSGKTAVAAAALFKAAKSGYQSALMAPTEILAKQHFDSLKPMFDSFGIKTALLTGSMKAKEKRESLEAVSTGHVQIVIGTHALIQEGVTYENLGLVITDEQHRFGVNQRIDFSKKGWNPHILVMTATPIPRTLAVILYGDLDISIIDELPAGRKEIITKSASEKQRDSLYQFVIQEVKNGRQAYIVAPLIEESEAMEGVASVEILGQQLNEMFRKYGIKTEILHGNMKEAEKDDKMHRFKENESDVLVATVVIEVGINVPNATVMVVESAERFGLSQLHQLRGRVGRGEYQSYCFLINNSKGDIAKKRMEIMCQSTDGFFISEKDLELRGPGEMFGTRQHGIPDESVISAVKHMDILELAKKDAKNYVNNISDDLKYKVEHMFGKNITFNL